MLLDKIISELFTELALKLWLVSSACSTVHLSTASPND